MIALKSAADLQNAIRKAQTAKPFVRVQAFGVYAVTNKQTGATYTVECCKRNGKRFAACDCKAGASGRACYHVAAAVGAHLQLAAERARAAQQSAR